MNHPFPLSSLCLLKRRLRGFTSQLRSCMLRLRNALQKHCCAQLCLALLLLCGAASCHKAETHYEAQAEIFLSLPDSITPSQWQVSLSLTHLDTRQTFTVTSFSGNAHSLAAPQPSDSVPPLRLTVLRGAYRVAGEGQLRYTDRAGRTHTEYFRVSSDYVEILRSPTSFSLPLIFL